MFASRTVATVHRQLVRPITTLARATTCVVSTKQVTRIITARFNRCMAGVFCRGFASDSSNVKEADLAEPETKKEKKSVTPVQRTSSLVITASGPDRDGIVHDLTKLLTTAGANVEESRMSILGNDFALLLRVTVPESLDAAKLKDMLATDFSEFSIGVRSTSHNPGFNGPVRILQIQVEGPDQPGIVQNLTKIFVDLKGSVRDLDTDSSNAPFAGYKIFALKCVVSFPMDADFDKLEKSLHAFEDKYGFDVQVHEGMNRDVDEELAGMDEEGMNQEDFEREDQRRGGGGGPRGAPMSDSERMAQLRAMQQAIRSGGLPSSSPSSGSGSGASSRQVPVAQGSPYGAPAPPRSPPSSAPPAPRGPAARGPAGPASRGPAGPRGR